MIGTDRARMREMLAWMVSLIGILVTLALVAGCAPAGVVLQ